MPNLPTEQHKNVISCACLIFKKGSILHTDFWKGYLGIDKKGYTHERVNHSDPENPFVGMKSKFVMFNYYFIGPSGIHTNRIESCWWPLKDFFRTKQFHPESLADHIIEYQWRRQCRKEGIDTFDALLSAVHRKYGV